MANPPQLVEPDELTAYVASEIRATMGRLNINRAELARRLSVEDSWVGKRLNGRTEIGVSDLGKIAEALGVKVVDLLPRSQREVTLWYPQDESVRRVGAFPQPALAAAISTPLPHGPLSISHPAKSVQPPGLRRTAPTGR